jgi:hypothetical protein
MSAQSGRLQDRSISPGPKDVLAQEAIAQVIAEFRKSAQTILALNRVDARDNLSDDAEKRLGPVTPNPIVRIKQRVSYRRADTEAKAATEIDKEAAAEIAELWKQIQRVVRKADGQAARHEQPAKVSARHAR